MKIGLTFLAFLLAGCSSSTKTNANKFCTYRSENIQSKHVIIMASSQQKKLGRCFQNFLQFEKEKNKSLVVCNTLNVAKNGKVTYTKVSGKGVPRDLKMCLEQEFWMMNFKALQLEKNVYVQFPLTFKSQ
jgi:protein involved in sex pheromone biosynthesis